MSIGYVVVVGEISGGFVLSDVAICLNEEDHSEFLDLVLADEDVRFFFSEGCWQSLEDRSGVNNDFFDRVIQAVEANINGLP